MHDAASYERVRSALSYLSPEDRDDWVKYGICIKSEFGPEGFDLWDAWGGQSDSHTASSAKSVWKSIKADGKRTIASLFYDAKAAGWKDSGTYKKPTKEEIEARKAAAAARAKKAAEEEAIAHAAAAERAQAIWDAATPVEGDGHPYLARKGVVSHELRVGCWDVVREDTGEVITVSEQALLVPIRDRKRNLWALQAILPNDKNLLRRDKDYLKGSAKAGNFYPIGKPQQRDGRLVFILGEGYATCASVHAATGHMVLVCFDTSNLLAVATALRESRPDAWIVFAADNDAKTDKNPGVTKARAAAEAVGGLVAVPPPGDFNDLQQAEGLEAVAGCIEAAFHPSVPDPEPEQPESETPPWDGPDAAANEAAPEVPAAATPAATPSASVEEVEDGEMLVPTGGHFTVLGYDGDVAYVFHQEKKQVVSRSRVHFSSDQGMVDLAPINWWEDYFPGDKGGINRVMAYEWFVRLAHRRGIYDPRKVRGRGAWRDAGRAVFHHGGHLTVDGQQVEIAQIESSWVYPMAHSLPAPSHQPVTDAEGAHLLSVAKMARWTRPGSAALLAGWIFLSPICGALKWRPHIWITGAAGSGKSTIQSDFVEALLSGIGHQFQGDSSEAGIRQTLGSDAIPVLIDEFEPNEESDRKRIKNILTLMRQASSETAAQTVKGTVSGDSMSFHIRSMFCVASINTMLEKDSDQSRITPLVLRPPAKSGDASDHWVKLQEELHKIAVDGRWPARLLARALVMLPIVLVNLEVFVRVAAKRFGTQRQGDQYGTLMAGAWCLSSSKVATDAEALEMINSYDWTDHTESTGGLGDPEKALAAIMESKIRIGSVDVTVYEILSEAAGRQVSDAAIGAGACVDILRRNGIRVEGKEMLFGVNTGSLRNLAKETPYATDIRGQLSRLAGAHNFGNKTRKYAGTNSKVVAVPLSLVLDDDQEPPI